MANTDPHRPRLRSSLLPRLLHLSLSPSPSHPLSSYLLDLDLFLSLLPQVGDVVLRLPKTELPPPPPEPTPADKSAEHAAAVSAHHHFNAAAVHEAAAKAAAAAAATPAPPPPPPASNARDGGGDGEGDDDGEGDEDGDDAAAGPVPAGAASSLRAIGEVVSVGAQLTVRWMDGQIGAQHDPHQTSHDDDALTMMMLLRRR